MAFLSKLDNNTLTLLSNLSQMRRASIPEDATTREGAGKTRASTTEELSVPAMLAQMPDSDNASTNALRDAAAAAYYREQDEQSLLNSIAGTRALYAIQNAYQQEAERRRDAKMQQFAKGMKEYQELTGKTPDRYAMIQLASDAGLSVDDIAKTAWKGSQAKTGDTSTRVDEDK